MVFRGLLNALGIELLAWQIWRHASWLFWIAVAYLVAYSLYVVIDWYVGLWRSWGIQKEIRDMNERRSTDGDVRGMTGPNTSADVCLSATLPMHFDAAKPSGQTPAAQAERKSPKAGAGSNPAVSHTHALPPIKVVPFVKTDRGYAFQFKGKH